MGERSYEVTRNPRPFANVLIGATMVGSSVVASGRPESGVVVPAIFIPLGVLMVVNGMHIVLHWPTRIVLRHDGIAFQARTFERLIAWNDLESVRVSQRRTYGGWIRWRFAQSPQITTASTFENLHRLLVEVEDHAPHARVTT